LETCNKYERSQTGKALKVGLISSQGELDVSSSPPLNLPLRTFCPLFLLSPTLRHDLCVLHVDELRSKLKIYPWGRSRSSKSYSPVASSFPSPSFKRISFPSAPSKTATPPPQPEIPPDSFPGTFHSTSLSPSPQLFASPPRDLTTRRRPIRRRATFVEGRGFAEDER